MNVRAKTRNNNRQKNKLILLAIVFVLGVGYHFARPTLQNVLGVSLPSLTGENDQVNNDQANNSNEPFDFDSIVVPNPDGAKSDTGSGNQSNESGDSNSGSQFRLTEVGRDRFESPAGLLYTMGPRREHRIEHIMRHARDMPDRPAHGVFEGDKYEILEMLDEAYTMIKQNSNRAKVTKEGNRTKGIVDMRRKVGYEGGQKGKRNGHRALEKVMLILESNRVITAYPYR